MAKLGKVKRAKPINRHKLVKKAARAELRREHLEKVLNAVEARELKRRGQEPAKMPIRLDVDGPSTVQEFLDATVNAPV